jgi:hypothetical protein
LIFDGRPLGTSVERQGPWWGGVPSKTIIIAGATNAELLYPKCRFNHDPFSAVPETAEKNHPRKCLYTIGFET